MELENMPTENNTHQRLFIFIGIAGVVLLIVCIAAYFFFHVSRGSSSQKSFVADATTTAPISLPKKTDFGTTTPRDFISNIPLEKGAQFNQSYSLAYPNETQLTVVFLSQKMMNQNYVLYNDFLKKNSWKIANTYEGKTVSSLYALKDQNQINITVSASVATSTPGSQVSISVLIKN